MLLRQALQLLGRVDERALRPAADRGRSPALGRDPAVSPQAGDEERVVESALRPHSLPDFIGQPKVARQLGLVLEGAKRRGRPPDHVLLSGPPGLGKTSLALIIGSELGTSVKITSGPAIERSGDLAAMLSNLAPGDVLFIDEIHRIARPAEELLYMAMEDFRVDVVVGKGPGATAIPLEINPFTLVGATTRAGPAHRAAARPVRLRRADGVLRAGRAAAGARPQRAPARRGAHRRRLGRDRRPLPRHAPHRQPAAAPGARLRRGQGRRPGHPGGGPGRARALRRRRPGPGPARPGRARGPGRCASAAVRSASRTLAVAVGEEPNTVEEVCEPFLVRAGLLARTPRGRVATEAAWRHLGRPLPRAVPCSVRVGDQWPDRCTATPGASSEPLFDA